MAKEKEEMKKEIISYFKEAFYVDGEVKIINEINDFIIDGVVELNDNERGQFYIARVKRKIKNVKT